MPLEQQVTSRELSERLKDMKKEKPDLSHCKKWYDKNECGSCGEEMGYYRGYNQAIQDLLEQGIITI